MTGKLALPTFVIGPEDKVATVDVYTETKDTVVNSIQDAAPAEKEGLLAKVMRGGKAMLKELPATLNMAAMATQVMKYGNPMQRIAGLSSVAAGALTKLSPDTAKSVFNMVGSATGPLSLAIGSASRLIPSTNLFNARVLTDTMNQITGTNAYGLRDSPGLIATATGMVNTAVGYGIPNSFSAFAKSGDFTEKLRIASNVMPGISRMGDIYSASDISKNLPFGSMSNMPNFSLNSVTGNYSRPMQCTANDYRTEYGGIRDSLSTISPNWNYATRDNVYTGERVRVPCVNTMINSSRDFQSVVGLGAMVSPSRVDKLQVLGGCYSQKPNRDIFTDVYNGLDKFFSSTFTNKGVTKPPVDPTLLAQNDLADTAYI